MERISRRSFLSTAVAGSVSLSAGCFGYQGGQVAFEDGFEEGFDGWRVGAAIGPEVPLEEFEREAAPSTAEAFEGSRSLRLFTEGDHDDGAVWATHAVPVEPGRAYEARVSVQAWSESESFNTLRDVLVRLGPTPPEREEDFPQPGVTSTRFDATPYGGLRRPLYLNEGWREYGFEWTTPRLETAELHLSVGVAAIWEADATNYVDAVQVRLRPR